MSLVTLVVDLIRRWAKTTTLMLNKMITLVLRVMVTLVNLIKLKVLLKRKVLLLPSLDRHLRMSTLAPTSQPFVIIVWDPNGLGDKTIKDPLSHVLKSHLFITETWLYGTQQIPTDWKQFHLYGSKVPGGDNRGRNGITAILNPSCPYPVMQIPSPNGHTLSFKIANLRVHCLYLPPRLSNAYVLEVLHTISLGLDTIICGNLNARMGRFLGDGNTNPRGTSLLPWLGEYQLRVLNQSLAFGVSTWNGMSNQLELTSSVIDLFITNIDPSLMSNAGIKVESDLSLGSDHRLLTLSFDLDTSAVINSADTTGDPGVGVRRSWNLSRLGRPGCGDLYRANFRSLVAPLFETISDSIAAPPASRPDIDAINSGLKDCLYSALNTVVDTKKPRPAFWKKYWTQDLQDLSLIRDTKYSKWRYSSGIDKL